MIRIDESDHFMISIDESDHFKIEWINDPLWKNNIYYSSLFFNYSRD